MPGILGRPVTMSPKLTAALCALDDFTRLPSSAPPAHTRPRPCMEASRHGGSAHLRLPCFSRMHPLCSAGYQQLTLTWHSPEPGLRANLFNMVPGSFDGNWITEPGSVDTKPSCKVFLIVTAPLEMALTQLTCAGHFKEHCTLPSVMGTHSLSRLGSEAGCICPGGLRIGARTESSLTSV